jgi:hypothetical protein
VSATYPVGEVSRAGHTVELRVDDGGNWLATVAGRELKHQTRANLISDIDRALRLEKKAVHIAFTYMESKNNGYVKLRHGVATGFHSGTGNLLIAWDDGSNGQMTVGSSADVLQRLSAEDEKKLAELTKTAYEAGEDLRNFIGRKYLYKGTKGLADQVQSLLDKGEK